MLDAYVECHKTRVLPLILEVASSYRMPLFNTMPDYARKAIRMAREAPGYSRKKPLEILANWMAGWSDKMPEYARMFQEAAREIREKNHLSPSQALV